MTQTYNAIVISTGVIGASLAFHLAERGFKPAINQRKINGRRIRIWTSLEIEEKLRRWRSLRSFDFEQQAYNSAYKQLYRTVLYNPPIWGVMQNSSA